MSIEKGENERKWKNKKIRGGNRSRPYREYLESAPVGSDSISAPDGICIKRPHGITLIALVITILFSYDEKLKCSNSKGFLLTTI